MTATKTSLTSRAPGSADDRLVVLLNDHVTWSVEPAWRDQLFGPDAPDWFALETSPYAQRVKSGHEREVWRVQFRDTAVYAKLRSVDPAPMARLAGAAFRFAASARREWRIAREASARGVPVVHFVAIGRRRGVQAADIIISEAIQNAQTLAAAWAALARLVERGVASQRQIIDAVARLFADAHQRGFAHRDNHPYNILVYPRNGVLAAVFVDVIPASLSTTRASRRRIVASLAHLDQYFHRVATRTERLRFLRRYLAYANIPTGTDPLTPLPSRVSGRGEGGDARLRAGQASHDDCRQLVAALLRVRARHALRLARRRDQRIRRKGKYFTTFRLGQNNELRATVVLDLERRHVFAEPQTPDRLESEWRNILGFFTDLPLDAVAGELARHNLHAETMRPRNGLARLKWTLFGSPHRRAFDRAHQLRHRDIPAPLLLAYVELGEGLVSRTFLIYPTPAS
jgi:tRNA A-37 threonylcarbamoyl transferase component Bud32